MVSICYVFEDPIYLRKLCVIQHAICLALQSTVHGVRCFNQGALGRDRDNAATHEPTRQVAQVERLQVRCTLLTRKAWEHVGKRKREGERDRRE